MQTNGTHTVTALRRWSCQDRQLPAVQDVKNIHIYDFDNTRMLFWAEQAEAWPGANFIPSLRFSAAKQIALVFRHVWTAPGPGLSAQWRMVA